DSRLSVEWTQPDLRLLSDLRTNGHMSAATYFRLLMPEILPREIERVIYLDADLLVRRDIGELWDVPMHGHATLAGQDFTAPWMDASVVFPNVNLAKKLVSAVTPVPNYRELGIAANSAYFNAGVLVVDLNRWRREKLAEKCLACLRQNREHVLFWDQYALNVVLHDCWGQLDLRWNQAAHVYNYRRWQDSLFDRETFGRVRSDPWIVHFCLPSKPWLYFCRHPFASDWRECQARTEWRGERPTEFMKSLWDYHYRPLRTGFRRNVKSVQAAIESKLRKAA
ncbi:MAG TPA: glycosyltransferase family 8 protein, partial [Lacipirellulaceae bacterium]|nr:glycosyltransferase family 8 protein [Lacipirellulaceae bacterium]